MIYLKRNGVADIPSTEAHDIGQFIWAHLPIRDQFLPLDIDSSTWLISLRATTLKRQGQNEVEERFCFRQGNFLLDVHLRYSCTADVSVNLSCLRNEFHKVDSYQFSSHLGANLRSLSLCSWRHLPKLKLQTYILFFRTWLRVEWYCDSMRARHAHVGPRFWKRLGPGSETRIARSFWDNSLYQLWRIPKNRVVRLGVWFTLAFPWLSIGFSMFHRFPPVSRFPPWSLPQRYVLIVPLGDTAFHLVAREIKTAKSPVTSKNDGKDGTDREWSSNVFKCLGFPNMCLEIHKTISRIMIYE